LSKLPKVSKVKELSKEKGHIILAATILSILNKKVLLGNPTPQGPLPEHLPQENVALHTLTDCDFLVQKDETFGEVTMGSKLMKVDWSLMILP
jgi:hypothetical protein